MASLRCPTCGMLFESTYTVAMPFCSERCRQIDLGHWLDEEHSIPVDIEKTIEDESSRPQGSHAAQEEDSPE